MVASRGRAAEARWHPVQGSPGTLRPGAAVLLLVLSGGFGLCAAAQAEDSVRTVTSSNWTLLLEGHWMLQFHAPWCPACQQIQPDWENFAKQGPVLDVNVAKVDVTAEPGLSGRFFVTKLPTLFHVKDGVFRRYHGSRMLEDLLSFIREKKWSVIEPVAGWKSPSSILMSGMAGLFHLSGWIRQTHNYFTGPLEIPAWGSYLIFIAATLLIGLILGLILVLLIDCCCPAKSKYDDVRADINEDVEELDKDTVDGKKLSNKKDVLEEESEEEEKEDEQAEPNEEAGSSSGAEKDSGEDSAVEDSGTEEEEDLDTQVPNPSTPESESALRQRKSEAVPEGGH
ncbi:thioredoxin-related transmembrane protein 4 [Hyperolius riggenbachi]|uniref:thioredoxin-related transmembrane protein 4 n=1 Tax=Hyperolius riggenbachi TaxID=752182 RepID=UPI0035A2FA2C